MSDTTQPQITHEYSAQTLLTAHDPQPVTVYNESALENSPVLIICDHSSNVIPKKLNRLGVDNATLEKHIAYDIGTETIGKYLADRLNAPAVLAGFSRLVIDLNRGLDHAGSIPALNDHIAIPGNENLSAAQKKCRTDEIYTPYHDKITDCLETIKQRGQQPFIISVHSFTPEMDNQCRETEIGILWDRNKDIAETMIQDLKTRNPALVVGDNDPYSFREAPELNHTLNRHGIDQNSLYMIVEFRQDLVGTTDNARHYADIFLQSLEQVMNEFSVEKQPAAT